MTDRELYQQFYDGTISEEDVIKELLQEGKESKAEYTLSEGQKGIWYSHTMNPDNMGYHIAGAFALSGGMNEVLLEEAINKVVKNHPELCKTFYYNGFEIFQKIKDDVLIKLEHLGKAESDYKVCLDKYIRLPFRFEQEVPLRACLLEREEGEKILLVVFHHLIFDLLSSYIFWRELQKYYHGLKDGFLPDREPVKDLYKIYILEEKKYLESAKARADKEFWMKKAPAYRRTKKEMEYGAVGTAEEYDCHEIITEETIYREAYCKGVTEPSFFMGLFSLALSKVMGIARPVIGIPVSRRNKEIFRDAMGYYVNMIAVVSPAAAGETLGRYMELVQEEVLEGLEHSGYPYHLLAKELHNNGIVEGELFHAALFYQDYTQYTRDSDFLYPLIDIQQSGEFPLVFTVVKMDKGYCLRLNYYTGTYGQEVVQALAQELTVLISTAADPEEIIERKAETPVLFSAGADNKNSWADTKAFPDMFLEQVKKTPGKTAVIYNEETVSYEVLYKKAYQLSLLLIKKGLKKGDFAGVLLERSPDLLVALLSVQMAGGVYLPLDPSYPKERLQYMVTEAETRLIILQNSTRDKLGESSAVYVNLDIESGLKPQSEGDYFQALCAVGGNDLAYIIFTSGSTGRPKGILIKHYSLSNFLDSMREAPGCDSNDYVLALTTICFDISLLELLLPLVTGAVLEILPENVAKDGIRLLEKVRASAVTIMQATPSTWNMLLAAGWQEKKDMKILIGGEAFSQALSEQLLELGKECWNLYGPTETTIWSSICKLEKNEEITIGTPIKNTEIFVIGEDGRLVGDGEIGEICIGGKGVAEGYLKNPLQTSQRFVQLPLITKASSVIYKTGDLGKVMPNGTIQFVGRNDQQVKYHGYRIELEEIASVLNHLEEIREAKVILYKTDTAKILLAFLLSRSGKPVLTKEELTQRIREKLPTYMLPGEFVYLKHFPLTNNGKINVSMLREMPLKEIINSFGYKEIENNNIINSNIINKPGFLDFMKDTVARIKKVEKEDIDINKPLGDYGFDSVSFTGLSFQINQAYSIDTNPTLFYTYADIESFSNYIIDKYMPVQAEKPMEAEKKKEALLEDIAIIGMGGVLPESESIEAFWKQLTDEKCLITEIPESRWDYTRYYDPDNLETNKGNSKWGGFLPGIDTFDAALFGISPKEARLMDPQQRLMLQVVWTAMENAGYKPSDFSGTDTGVYIGATGSDYAQILMRDTDIEPHTISGMVNAMIANRISYVFNLHGPSEVIDTACSSGLTAFCQAVQAVSSGNCEMAIAGSVNLILSPLVQVALSKTGMLSKEGLCKTFDFSADGYVRGEGCICFLLKKVSKARRDKDHIYAIVKGICLNHGGKTNSLTAPNAKMQTKLIKKAVEDAGINPYTIAYMETHGTGTALGDPIEWNAIKQAFAEMFEEWDKGNGQPAPCGIGSVKTNAGHLEAASGAAGLLKTVLSLERKWVPPSLHLHQLNPYLDMDNTNLYITEKGIDLKAYKDKYRICPIHAGVSSFGFGGANAHVVLEENLQEELMEENQEKCIFLLSAANINLLREYAGIWIGFLQTCKTAIILKQLAYVLQNGREAMAVRLAAVIDSREELLFKLSAYLMKEENIPAFYYGTADRDALKENLADIRGLDLEFLAQAWVSGKNVPWVELYEGEMPYRLPLPTYPFAKQRFWVENHNPNPRLGKAPNYPLIDNLDYERSLKKGVAFKKNFRAKEPILMEHRVQGHCILPAAAYLEMVLEAFSYIDSNQTILLKEILWLQPFTLFEESEKELILRIFEDKGERIFLAESENNGKTVLHCQGKIDNLTGGEGKSFRVHDMISRSESKLTGTECYRLFREEVNLDYGPYFQGIKEVYYNEEEALGRIAPDNSCTAEISRTVLHPVIMDCALQITGIMFRNRKEMRAPFSAENIRIYKTGLIGGCYCHVVKKNEEEYDICIMDEDGNPYMEFINYTSKTMAYRDNPAGTVKTEECNQWEINTDKENNGEIYNLVWKEIQPETEKEEQKENSGKVLLLHNGKTEDLLRVLVRLLGPAAITKQIAKKPPQDQESLVYKDIMGFREIIEKNNVNKIYFLSSLNRTVSHEPDIIMDMQKYGIYPLTSLLKALEGFIKNLQIIVVTNYVFPVNESDMINPVHGSIRGMVKSAALEYPEIRICQMDIDYSEDTTAEACEDLVNRIIYAASRWEWCEIALRRNKYYVQKAVNCTLSSQKEISLRRKGVYIIAGAGGIGTEIARYLYHNYSARVILVSRSDMESAREKALNKLDGEGIPYTYVQADINNLPELDNLFVYVEQTFGAVHGIFHCAMVLKDILIKNMTESKLQEVLEPKVQGSINLFKLARERNLDFLFFFSSLSAVLGNPGQSNYSAAGAFMDTFAHYCRLHSNISIKLLNSSFWGEAGSVSDKITLNNLCEKGLIPIRTAEGISIIEKLLGTDKMQILYFKAQPWFPERMDIFEKQEEVKTEIDRTVDWLYIKEGIKKLEFLAFLMLLDYIQKAGFLPEAGQTADTEDVFMKAGIHIKYKELFLSFLRILEENHIITREKNSFFVKETIGEKELQGEIKRIGETCTVFMEEYPELVPYLILLQQCLANYEEVLSGRVSYAEVMFPQGSKKMVSDIYKGNPFMDYYNTNMALTIRDYVAYATEKMPGQKINILEIGAGTGASTKEVLKSLNEYQDAIRYYYTDISVSFLNEARNKFSAYDCIRFKILNIEDAPEEQGFEPESFHVVLASNVLHATSDIGQSLRNINTLLRKEGLCVINEITKFQYFATLTFGLTSGWWLFKDNYRMDNAPLLTVSAWENVLSGNGFTGVEKLSLDEEEDRIDQCIFTARKSIRVSSAEIYKKR